MRGDLLTVDVRAALSMKLANLQILPTPLQNEHIPFGIVTVEHDIAVTAAADRDHLRVGNVDRIIVALVLIVKIEQKLCAEHLHVRVLVFHVENVAMPQLLCHELADVTGVNIHIV